ncbi:unnamed protein product, partial [Rotaria sp. Silwood1]
MMAIGNVSNLTSTSIINNTPISSANAGT